ncbi:hypothetical protein EDD17DRAFT_90226 [Pisolithus thermaeus]|nr:hypothetical protein EDD17DRAFT_90226 [Pisolithus thermaeus]
MRAQWPSRWHDLYAPCQCISLARSYVCKVSAALSPYIVQPIHTDLTMYPTQLNSGWSAEDVASLIENGHLEKYSTCRWILPDYMPCNETVKGRDFSSHLRDRHGVTGAPSSQHRCCWEGCHEREFNRDCLIRHLREQHLQWRWPCPTCEQDFTRKNTMFEHRDKSCPRRLV